MYPLRKSLRLLADTFDRLGISYLIGGPVASGVRSVARATRDIDIVARIGFHHVARLAEALGPDWYADQDQMKEAVRRERAFNLIHMIGGHKFDIFPATQEFHSALLQRATEVTEPFLGEERGYPVASAEDILLRVDDLLTCALTPTTERLP